MDNALNKQNEGRPRRRAVAVAHDRAAKRFERDAVLSGDRDQDRGIAGDGFDVAPALSGKLMNTSATSPVGKRVTLAA
jgi:hypothetical protein